MFRPELGSGQGSDYVPTKPSDINQELDKVLQMPGSELYADSMLAYSAEAKRFDAAGLKQASDRTLPEVQLQENGDGKFSDAPPNPPVLDDQGRVQSINYADGTSRQFTYKDGHVDTYKDRDGHTWKFSEPNVWTQQDGKSVLHGEMIVDKDGSFTFMNHDKDYISHYGADGKEKVDAQKNYDSYTHDELIALQAAGDKFAATGLPQDSVEKPKKEAKSETADTPAPDKGTDTGSEKEVEKPGSGAESGEKAADTPAKDTDKGSEKVVEQEKLGKVMPLNPEAVQAFARNFQMDPAEVARIGSLTLEQVRAEMLAVPAGQRPFSQKYRFYGEMVYRLTDGRTTSAYSSSDLT